MIQALVMVLLLMLLEIGFIIMPMLSLVILIKVLENSVLFRIFVSLSDLEMVNSSGKKLVPKGVRLGWVSLKDAKLTKVTVSLSSLKGVKVKKKKVSAARNSAEGSFISKPAFLIP